MSRNARSDEVANGQHPLEDAFYARPTLTVAHELLGKILIRHLDSLLIAGRIVETEAYQADIDQSCHAYRRQTLRNRSMFGPAGHAYVYRSYGIHYCLNVVTTLPGGPASAVLIRALEPLAGLAAIRERRGVAPDHRLLSGPGNLCRAMSIDPHLDGQPLSTSALSILDGPPVQRIVTTRRIGITRSIELPWRFYDWDSPAVSRRDRQAEHRLQLEGAEPRLELS